MHLVPVGTQRPDKERFFLGDLGLTRWMYGTVRPTVIPIDASRVVAIAPDYVNPEYELPRAREEVTTLGQLLARGPRSAADPVELRQAIADGFVAVTPLHLDLTHESSLATLAGRYP